MSYQITYYGDPTGETFDSLRAALERADALGRGHDVHADDINWGGTTLRDWSDLDEDPE